MLTQGGADQKKDSNKSCNPEHLSDHPYKKGAERLDSLA
jgi:hypothetical protein